MPSTPPIKVPILGVDEYTKQFQKMVSRAKKLGQSVEAVGRKLTTMVTVPLVGAGVASMKFAKDFNAAMANVGTLIPGQTERLKGLKKEVMSLSAEIGKDQKDLAGGLYEVISAFPDEKNPIRKLDLAARAAKAGLSNTTEALGLLALVTKKYGDTSDSALERVADLSMKTVQLGQTSFPELATSMGDAITMASNLNIPMEQVFATMASLTTGPGSASRVATQLASLAGAFIKPTSGMTRFARGLKDSTGHAYKSAAAMISDRGLSGALQAISDAGMGSADKLGKLIQRKEALVIAMDLMGKKSNVFAENLKAMADPAGALNAAFKEQTDGLNKEGYTWDKTVAKFKNFAIVIGDKLLPVVSKFLDRLKPFFERISKMSDASLTAKLKLAGVAAALGPFLILVGKGIGIVSSIVGAIGSAGGLAGVLAAVTGPVGLVIGAIAGLVGVAIYCRDEIQSLVEAFAGPVRLVVGEIKDLFQGTGESAGNLGQAIKTVVGFMSNLIAPVVKLVTKIGLLPMRWLVRMLDLAGGVVGRLSKGFNLFSKAIQVVWHWLKNLVTGWMETSKAGQFFKSILDGISSAVESVWGWIKNLWDQVSGFLSGVVEWFDKLGVQLDETLTKTLQAQEGGAKRDIVAGMAEAKAAESHVTLAFEGLPEGVTPKVTKQKGGRLDVRNKGAIMQGAI